MSHSLTIEGHTASFNGDFSGEVTIWLPRGGAAFPVPFTVLEAIVAEKYRRAIVSYVEDASPEKILASPFAAGER